MTAARCNTDDIRLYNFSVTPLSENEFEARAADIVTQVKQGAFTMPLFCMTLNPEGIPVWDKAGKMAKLYARYRDRLAQDGVEAGILVQASLGHGYTITKNPFTAYVNLTDGEEAPVCCPLDDAFIAHFCDVLRTLAKEKPKAIMLDDDFRLMMRSGRGCTCHLHMAEFNRRAGVDFDRETLLSHIQTHGKTDPLTRIYAQTQRDALIHAATAFRAAIDEIDPTIQGINCTSGHLCESVIDTNKIFAGKGNPTMVRVPNGCYAPYSVREFSNGMCQAAICGAKLKKGGIDVILAETDTIPFNRYAKSARYLHAHFTSSILEGLQGAKHWLTRTSAFEPQSGAAYRAILAKNKGLYQRLAALAGEIKWIGCNSAFIEQKDFDFLAPAVWRYQENFWVTKTLERMGIPFFFSEESADATFLEGESVRDMTDEHIKSLFTGSVFLDGASAAILCERGYGHLLGVDVSPWNLGTVSGETFDGTLYQSCTGQKNPKKLTVADSATEILSYNYLRCDGCAKLLAPAVTVLPRENGKITVVFCGSPDAEFLYTEGFAFLNETRKQQLISLLRRANALPVYCEGDDEICLRAGYLADRRLLVAVFSLGTDPIEGLRLHLDQKPEKITVLTSNGSEAPVAFTYADGVCTVQHRVEILDPLLLLIQ